MMELTKRKECPVARPQQDAAAVLLNILSLETELG